MSDTEGAPEAQEAPAEQQQPGIRVEPQFIIQSLQAKVAQLTEENMMLEALANQQQAVTQQLAQQVVALQAANEELTAAAAIPQHDGRVTPAKAKKQAAKA